MSRKFNLDLVFVPDNKAVWAAIRKISATTTGV